MRRAPAALRRRDDARDTCTVSATRRIDHVHGRPIARIRARYAASAPTARLQMQQCIGARDALLHLMGCRLVGLWPAFAGAAARDVRTVGRMATPRRGELVSALRQRVLRAVQIGALAPGDRLPGVRALAGEFDADPRVVAEAYRVLEAEGLVTMRPRSGVYVAEALRVARPRPSPRWMAELFAAGIARGIPAHELPGALSAALGRGRIRAVVVATTVDQTDGICRELIAELGVECRGVLAETLDPRQPMPRVIRRAQLLVSTEAHEARMRRLAARLGMPFVSITVRADLFDSEWALLRGQVAYVLVADPRFGRLVRSFIDAAGGHDEARVLVAGRDDLSRIPPYAPVYATQAARARIGPTRLPDGVLPPGRILSDESVRELMQAIIGIASGAS